MARLRVAAGALDPSSRGCFPRRGEDPLLSSWPAVELGHRLIDYPRRKIAKSLFGSQSHLVELCFTKLGGVMGTHRQADGGG